MRRRGLLALALGFATALGACRTLLPERWAVNAPIAHLLWGGGIGAPPRDAVPTVLRAADGFTVALWADGLPNARFLRVTAVGDLLVSQPRLGTVALVERDADGDGAPDGVRPLVTGLDRPHGIDLHDGWLWIAETGAVGRIRFDAATRATSGAVERVIVDLPSGGRHWTRTLRIGPDGLVYVSVGSSCNVCEEEEPRRAAITRWRPDGRGAEPFATGLRNAVGFTWHPTTGVAYATDNGRDHLGDDLPPCELNRLEAGGFYGWPYAYGDRVPDPAYGARHPDRVAASLPPVHAFRAHTAPLGITFLASPAQPESHRGAALVALHGSWNRTRKDGYAVVALHPRADGGMDERPFLTGFLRPDETVIGRPVDVAEAPDGTIYVSDDYAGAVYVVRAAAASRAEAAHGAGAGGGGAIRRGGAAGVSGAAHGAGGAGPPGARHSAEPAASAALGARGAALFASQGCPECHGPQASAPARRPLVGLAGRYTIASLAAYLVAPTPPMPAVDLPEDERRALAVHLLDAHP